MIDMQSGQGVTTAVLAGRAALARQVVDFLEHHVPALLIAAFGFGGSLVLLPVGVLNWRYGQRAATVNVALNDAAEREVDVIGVCERAGIAAHFTQVARLKVRLSNAEARTWGAVELFVIAITIAVLFLLTHSGSHTPGESYAALAYL